MFKKSLITFSITTVLMAGNVNATGIPTVDLAALPPQLASAINSAKSVVNEHKHLIQQAKDLKAQYEQLVELKNNLVQAEKTFGSITGLRDLSKLLNTEILKDYRDNLPDDIGSGLDLFDVTAVDIKKLQYDLTKIRSRSKYQKYLGGDKVLGQKIDALSAYADLADRTMKTELVANLTFDNSKQGLKNAETLIEEVDKAEDLKASSDLTNRMLAENLVLMNKMLQTQSTSMLQQSAHGELEFEREMLERQMIKGDMSEVDFGFLMAGL